MHYSKEDEEFAQHSHNWNRILMTDEYRAELLLGGRIWSYPGLIPICDDLIVSDWQHTVTMMMLQIRNQHLHCTGICILLYNLWWVNYDEKGIEFIFTPFREFVCKKDDDDATRRRWMKRYYSVPSTLPSLGVDFFHDMTSTSSCWMDWNPRHLLKNRRRGWYSAQLAHPSSLEQYYCELAGLGGGGYSNIFLGRRSVELSPCCSLMYSD